MTSTSRRSSPTVRRRLLSAEIRRLRTQAGMKATEASNALGWSQGKLTKMELGEWIRPNPRDIEDLCKAYSADKATTEHLVEVARQSKEKDGWWHPYRAMVSPAYSTYIGLEAGASELQVFEALLIHGLLQTEAYARAVFIDGPGKLSPEQVEQRVLIRAGRQQLLTGDDPLDLWVVLHEAALRTLVGDHDIMREQLYYILKTAERPNVTVQVVPFSAGAHPGVQGGFTVMSFPEDSGPSTGYLENPVGNHFIEQEEEVKGLKDAYRRLIAKALPIDESLKMIAALAA